MIRNAMLFETAAVLSSILLAPCFQSRAHARDRCYGDWTPAAYAVGTLAEVGPNARGSTCQLGGRIGHAAVTYNWYGGNLEVHAWVCDEDGNNCGVDVWPGVQCFGDAQTRDSSEGTDLDDGQYGFMERTPSVGEEVGDVPMDENANYISQVYMVRVQCIE